MFEVILGYFWGTDLIKWYWSHVLVTCQISDFVWFYLNLLQFIWIYYGLSEFSGIYLNLFEFIGILLEFFHFLFIFYFLFLEINF